MPTTQASNAPTHTQGTDRRAQSLKMIQQLVGLRTETLVLFSELARKKPFQKSHDVPELLQKFCASLIDYTADGHFQLYRHIAERTERRQAVKHIAEQIYPRIMNTTETILAFNGKYDSSEHAGALLAELDGDLSMLGERLADRIELEDRLISALNEPRTPQA